MLIFAALLNVVVGLKVTPIVQEAPAARVAPQLLLLAKYVAPVPVRMMLLIEKAVTPLFVRVALSIPLVVPTGTLTNLRLVGLTEADRRQHSLMSLARMRSFESGAPTRGQGIGSAGGQNGPRGAVHFDSMVAGACYRSKQHHC